MITETQAAGVLKYLVAAGALNAIDDQHVVWADYLNNEFPETLPADLLPAARLCLAEWASGKHGWKVDLPRYAKSVRTIRRKRIEKTLGGRPLLPQGELNPEKYLTWMRVARRMLGDGATLQEATERAWNTLGINPPEPPQMAGLQRKQGIIRVAKDPRDDGNHPGV